MKRPMLLNISATFLANFGDVPRPGGWLPHRPNMLVGTICRGRGLKVDGSDRPLDSYTATRAGIPFESSPTPPSEKTDSRPRRYATVRIGRNKTHSPTVRRSGAPAYDHAFRLPTSDGHAVVVVKVKERGILGTRLVGRATIPMVEVAAYGDPGFSRWLKLEGADGAVGADRGAVELQLAWIRDRQYARSLARLAAGAAALFRSTKTIVQDDDAADDDGDDRAEPEAWMVEEDAFAPLVLTSQEAESRDERREAGVTMADRAIEVLFPEPRNVRRSFAMDEDAFERKKKEAANAPEMRAASRRRSWRRKKRTRCPAATTRSRSTSSNVETSRRRTPTACRTRTRGFGSSDGRRRRES